MNVATRGCSQTGCKVAAPEGKCLEGRVPPESCPYFREQPTQIASAPAPTEVSSEEWTDIHPALEIGLTGASRISRTTGARLILLAGAVKSGKTTLLTAIYDAFQSGTFASLQFAGSETLIGFERRCHDSRLASGRESPETERTRSTENPDFLHLRVRDQQGEATDVLFTDISGELFDRVKNSDAECRKVNLFLCADHVAVLMDGDRLKNNSSRNDAVQDARSLLRIALDAGMLDQHSFVDIVFTKWDLLATIPPTSPAIKFVDNVCADFERTFAKRLGRLRCVRVAARPHPNPAGLPAAFNLTELLPTWVNESRRARRATAATVTLRDGTFSREFDRFGRVDDGDGHARVQ